MVRPGGSCSGASYKEWRNFMSSNLADMYQKPGFRKSGDQKSEDQIDLKSEEMEIKNLLRDVERLGSTSRTWKERKAIENQTVVGLGAKPQKKHRTPLSVALPAMKNKKKREQRQLEEDLAIGRSSQPYSGGKTVEKRKQEDRVLRSSEGYFKKGVLDVKHMLRAHKHANKSSRDNDFSHENISKGKNSKKAHENISKGKNSKKGNKKGNKKGKRKGR